MESVAFITCEIGTDIIVSFAVQNPRDPETIESLTIIRTPKYEHFLPVHERGASVSFEREKSTIEDELSILKEVSFDLEKQHVVVVSTRRHYELDTRKASEADLKKMCRVFRKMNYDSSIKFVGI